MADCKSACATSWPLPGKKQRVDVSRMLWDGVACVQVAMRPHVRFLCAEHFAKVFLNFRAGKR